jgi:putative transcriptional regulator
MGCVERSLRGHLLIATPALTDPNFRKSVVLIAEHTAEGAMGLVLNRRTPAAVDDAAPHLSAVAGDGARVWVGGPVERQSVFVLAEFDDPAEAGALVMWDVGLLPLDLSPGEGLPATRRARVFAGYAGWGPGQLEGELDEEAWIVAEPADEDVFTADPDRLWSAVLRRKGGQYGVIALMPDDPRLN